MIADLKPYPAYKDSGVEWLSQVPEHWQVRRLKASTEHVVEQTRARRPDDMYIALEHVEGWTGGIRPADVDVEFDSQVSRFRAGDVLFGKLRPYLAKVTRVDRDGVCTGEFLVLRPRDSGMSSPFLEALLRSKPIIDAVNSSTFGARMPRADWRFVGGMAIAIPPADEQVAIIRYLDHVDARIQRLITAKERLIELLEEEKQAIIHSAVTHGTGLKPRTNSASEGGDIPASWRVTSVRREFECLNHRRCPLSAEERGEKQGPFPYYGASGIIDHIDQFIFDEDLLLVAEDGANLVLRNLPLAIVATGRYWVNNHAHILRPRTGDLYFMQAKLESLDLRPFVTGAAQPKLTKDRLMGVPLAVPEPVEQRVIMEMLEGWNRPAVTATARAQQEISLLRELRTRLISDVVTGNLDVREAAARLPDDPDAEVPELDEALEEAVV